MALKLERWDYLAEVQFYVVIQYKESVGQTDRQPDTQTPAGIYHCAYAQRPAVKMCAATAREKNAAK